MWTPKRIVLLALGFLVFFSGYLLYASCLGGINGLPPLPDADLPNPGGDALGPAPPRGEASGNMEIAWRSFQVV